MGLTLANLNTRLQMLVGDTTSGEDANRVNALADADVELSSIKGHWRVRSHAYTTVSSPSMAADSYQLNTPTSPAFDSPFRLYYRDSGIVKDVKIKSRSEWLALSDTSQSDYPRWFRVAQTASTTQLELDRKLSSAFVANIGTLTLEYYIAITRLSGTSDESILPDNLRLYIVPVAGHLYALGQGDVALADRLRVEAERARDAVRLYDLEFQARPRQIRPTGAYAPGDLETDTGDYR